VLRERPDVVSSRATYDRVAIRCLRSGVVSRVAWKRSRSASGPGDRNGRTGIRFGCRFLGGSSGGLGDEAEGVAWGVDAAAFLGEVKVPVGVEVAVADERAEFRDGFGCVESPARACDVRAVFDEVSAGAFDDAGRDRPAVARAVG
jgi:hypothetical protein